MAHSCMTSVVSPQPLTKHRARKIHISLSGAMPRRKKRIRLAAAAAVTPTAQTSFLPILRAMPGSRNIITSIGE